MISHERELIVRHCLINRHEKDGIVIFQVEFNYEWIPNRRFHIHKLGMNDEQSQDEKGDKDFYMFSV